MPDRDQRAEELDDSALADELPPDEPLGADEPGAARHERETLAERDRRTEPDQPSRPGQPTDVPHAPVTATGVPPTDRDDEDTVAVPVDELDDTGPLAPDDELSGDETERDVATERIPRPAEEAAMHVEGEPPGRPDRPDRPGRSDEA